MESARTNQTARTAEPLPADGPAARIESTKTVLVVDDNDDIREATLGLLKSAGYATRSAGDGAEALALLREGGLRPCLILLDLMMPVMDGFEFRDQQLRYPALAAIPVVVVSSFGRETAARVLGITDYLAKPIDIDRLLELVEQHCGPRNLGVSTAPSCGEL